MLKKQKEIENEDKIELRKKKKTKEIRKMGSKFKKCQNQSK